jgi:excisionase family DNA binding protein
MLTTKQVADELGISLRQVQTLIQRKHLPAEKFGRDYMIKSEDLELVRQRRKGRPLKNIPSQSDE